MNHNGHTIIQTHRDQSTRSDVTLHLEKTRAETLKEVELQKQGESRCIDHSEDLSPSLILEAVSDLKAIRFFESIDSTNTYAKTHKIDSNTLILTQHQTEGRGRFGRTFYAPRNKGIYMSIVLEPTLEYQDTQLITVCAGLAVCRGLESVGVYDASIKWLNDIYLDGKKVCGILTEGEFDMESRSIQRYIVGIGLNTEYDTETARTLGSIYTALNHDSDKRIDKNVLCSSILNHFYELYKAYPQNRARCINQYKEKSMVLGQTVTLSNQPGIFKAVDITEAGHLVVQDIEGNHVHLNAGEVSIKEMNHEH